MFLKVCLYIQNTYFYNLVKIFILSYIGQKQYQTWKILTDAFQISSKIILVSLPKNECIPTKYFVKSPLQIRIIFDYLT